MLAQKYHNNAIPSLNENVVLLMIIYDYRNLKVLQDTLQEMATAIIREFLQPDKNGLKQGPTV